MIFTNPQTALIFEWMDANIYLEDLYQECTIHDDFQKQLETEANTCWSQVHPEFGELADTFFPVFWDEIAKAFKEKFRKRWDQVSTKILTKNISNA